MTYNEAVEYLYSQMPMYERQGRTGYKEGLENTLALDEHFGHPHTKYRTIHIAGTNGKGSCANAIAAILQANGKRVGLYTSPHILDFSERIQVNGAPVRKDYVVKFIEEERAFFEPLHPSFFEVTTALAFKYFADEAVEYAVIEVGLGGRLDCTNIITPILSVITNISLDHTQLLGNTLAQIAHEKAGIIKQGVPVVVGESTPETCPVFEARARQMNAPITFTRQESADDGDYQRRNARTISTAMDVLNKECGLNFEKELSLHSLTRLLGEMNIPCRWQTVSERPKVILDAGHNAGAWKYIATRLSTIHNLHVIIGFVADKDIESIASLLPMNATYYFTKPNSKRALNEHALAKTAAAHGIKGTCFENVSMAYEAARTAAAECATIFVGGSFYLLSDFLKQPHLHPPHLA